MSDSSIHLPGLEITDPELFVRTLSEFLVRRGRPHGYAGNHSLVKVGSVFFAIDTREPGLVGPFPDLVRLYRALADGEVLRLPEGEILTVDGALVAIGDDGRIHDRGEDLGNLVFECGRDVVLSYEYESDGMAGGVTWSIVRFLGAYFITHCWDGWDVNPGPYPTFEAALEGGGETMRFISPDGRSVIRSTVLDRDEIEAHFTRRSGQARVGEPIVVSVNGEECVWGVGQ